MCIMLDVSPRFFSVRSLCRDREKASEKKNTVLRAQGDRFKADSYMYCTDGVNINFCTCRYFHFYNTVPTFSLCFSTPPVTHHLLRPLRPRSLGGTALERGGEGGKMGRVVRRNSHRFHNYVYNFLYMHMNKT
jgi:hypothetical protein